MLKSSLFDHSDGPITVQNTAAAEADANNTNEKEMFKNCAPFPDCMSKINNTQVDNTKNIYGNTLTAVGTVEDFVGVNKQLQIL